MKRQTDECHRMPDTEMEYETDISGLVFLKKFSATWHNVAYFKKSVWLPYHGPIPQPVNFITIVIRINFDTVLSGTE